MWQRGVMAMGFKRGIIFVLAGVFSFAVFCQSRNAEGLVVVTTIPDIADWVKAVGGERVLVKSILSGGEEPHSYEPNPGDVELLNRAKVVLRVGLGLDDWLDGLLANSGNPGLKILKISEGVTVIGDDNGEHHGKEGKHIHGEGNPHIWLDPEVARIWVERLSWIFSGLQPADSQFFQHRATEYIRELDSTVSSLRKKVDAVSNREFVAMHNSWVYFCRAFGFKMRAAVEPLPGQEPSVRFLASLAKTMRAESVRVIVVEPHHNRDVAMSLARDAGAEVIVLGSITGSIPGAETYLKLITYNVNILVEALSRNR